MLDAATKEFEATFAVVGMGAHAAYFRHNGRRYDYVVVSGGVVVDGGYVVPVYDTVEIAIEALRQGWKPFEGKKYLFWRIRPEIMQDKVTFDGLDNPNYGKWKTYSRFRAID